MADKVDYCREESWIRRDIVGEKSVDVFYVYPTVYAGTYPRNFDFTVPELRKAVNIPYFSQIGVYSSSANVYAPYYRQVTFRELDSSKDMFANTFFQIGAQDIIEAFRYYLENYNAGKPFILAGHSQGAMILLNLLREEFADEKLQQKLVAAYLIGYSVTAADLLKYPWIKAAKGRDDLGIVISYNTQEPDATGSPVLYEGAICINPLSWDVSGRAAAAELNLGAVFFNDSGEIIREVAGYTGAEVNPETGALMTSPADDQLDVRSFPRGVYHVYDYAFWYRNLEQNVKDRIKAFYNGR